MLTSLGSKAWERDFTPCLCCFSRLLWVVFGFLGGREVLDGVGEGLVVYTVTLYVYTKLTNGAKRIDM